MKFGQSLEAHMVPEWKAQYLDYKAGKKKLKKLGQKPSVLNSLKSTPTLKSQASSKARSRKSSNASPLDRTSNTTPKLGKTPIIGTSLNVVAEDDDEDENNNGKSLSIVKTNAIEDQLTLDSNTSFALPGAALDFNGQSYGSNSLESPKISTHHSLANIPSHDKTPLLGVNDTKTRTLGSKSRLSTPHSNNSNLSASQRRSSVIGLFDSFRRNRSFSYESDNDTELEDLSNYARQKFIEWVDSELNKIESFYEEREKSCVERYLVLQDQVFQLENQKALSKKKWQQRKRRLQSTNANLSPHMSLNGDRNSVDDYDIDDEEDEDDDEDDEDDEDDDDNIYEDYLNSNMATFNNGVINSAQRNFQLLSFWTRRKLRIVNKFDMPSLPAFEWLKNGGKIEKQYYEEGYFSNDEDNEDGDNNHGHPHGRTTSSNAHVRDFQRKKEEKPSVVPYFVARRMIKKAVYELYRSMELLKSYKLMNRIAFRKLIKKYDKTTKDSLLNTYMKKIDDSYFSKSETLDNLMTNVEELYTRYFENGNRKVSIAKLRTSAVEKTYYVSDYFSGLFLGIAIPFVILAFVVGIHRTQTGYFINGKYLLQIWGGFFVMLLMAWLFSINCLVWTKYKVNYKFIFEFNQHDTLDFKQYMVLPSLLFFFGGIIAWLSFHDFWPNTFSGYDFPWLFLAVSMAILLCPFDMFFLNARLWLLSTFTRLLLSGFYPVEFKDFFLGDIFCSLTYSISNVSMFFCIYGNHWNNCVKCGSSESRLLGFLQCVPSIWRFLQCFRRYADTGDWFPHLANMGKYSVSTLYYMSLSLYRIETISKYKILLIFWASFNSIYSTIWDIVMDWSLFQFDSKHFLLRDEITFKKPEIYYWAIIIDIILRFQWVFYVLFPKQIQQSAITSFCIAISEVLRRFVWIFFRMENEHATNVHLFRASRESPLPYPTKKRKNTIQHQESGDNDISQDITDQNIRRRNGINITNPALSKHAEHQNVQYRNIETSQVPASYIPTVLVNNEGQNITDDIESGGGGGSGDKHDGDMAYTSGVFLSLTRFAKKLSQSMRTAHIKDFQRRKVTKNQKQVEEEDDGEEEADDNNRDN